MKVLWSIFALNSLKNIFTYYKENVGIIVAQNIKENILSGSRQFVKQPFSGAIEPYLLKSEKNIDI